MDSTPHDGDREICTLVELAGLARAEGRYLTAERLFRKILARNMRPLPARTRLLAQNNLALTWRHLGWYRKSRLLLNFTMSSAEALFGRDSVEVAATCNEWAVLCKYTGDYKQAENLYLRALSIYESTYGKGHESIATICHNIGGLSHSQGNFQKGEIWARRAIEIRKQCLGEDHPKVAADISAWAALLIALGRNEEAERNLYRAMRIFEASPYCDPTEMAYILHNLAAIARRRDDFTSAITTYRRALAIKRNTLGLHNPECASTLVNLAACLYRAGMPKRAAVYYSHAQDILKLVVAPDHPILSIARRGLVRTEWTPR